MRIAKPLPFAAKQMTKSMIKRIALATLSFTLLASGVMAGQNLLVRPQTAQAAAPPDSCFAFDAVIGTITDYYDHEGNNPANPACPKAVDIPSTIGGVPVTIIGNASYPGAFTNKNLTSVTIPSSVTSIGNSAFYNNQLTSLTIPSSVTSIGSIAFSNNQLTNLTIPSSVTSIGNSAFSSNQLTSLTIPNNVTSIGEGAFSYNQLTSLTIPNNVTSIGEGAFSYNQLTSLTIPNSVTSIGEWAFGDNQLTNLAIPNSVTSIGNGAFSDNQLTSLTIPNSVTSIGNFAFSYNQLTNLTIPSGVTSIGDSAFYYNQLTNLTIPSSVTSIGDGAFRNNQLTSLTIPSSVTSIGERAFAYQSQWGRYIYYGYGGQNGAPDLWSDDLAEVQRALDSFWYVRLTLEDSSNPHGLVNDIAFQCIKWGESSCETTAIVGGHLINPASAEIQYVNSASTSLRASQTFTGKLGSNHLTNYYVTQGPTVPVPAESWNITSEEQQAIDNALSAYYRIGNTATFTPPPIAGYITPPAQTKELTAANNNLSFTYNQQVLSVPFANNTVTGGTLAPSTTPASITSPLIKESNLAIANDGACSAIESAELLAPGVVTAPASVTILGGLQFSLSCSSAATTTVTLTLGSKADLAQLRIYKEASGTLTDITHQVALANTNGKTVLSYEITDGGSLDEDGVANGTIVDPIYIGVIGDAGGSLANTGFNVYALFALAAALLTSAVAIWRKSAKAPKRVSLR